MDLFSLALVANLWIIQSSPNSAELQQHRQLAEYKEDKMIEEGNAQIKKARVEISEAKRVLLLCLLTLKLKLIRLYFD